MLLMNRILDRMALTQNEAAKTDKPPEAMLLFRALGRVYHYFKFQGGEYPMLQSDVKQKKTPLVAKLMFGGQSIDNIPAFK